MCRIFILSPANSGGERAALLYNPRARFDLAVRLQRGDARPLAEVFSFLSGLYFRGKITYALKFARPPAGLEGAYVITSSRGLVPAFELVNLGDLRGFAAVPIDPNEPRYVEPLRRDVLRLGRHAGRKCTFVLLGSIGTKKYAEQLLQCLGERLLFPSSFVGRGDMSRGSLLLRSAADDQELEYAPVAGAIRHGKRPEKLTPRTWGYKILSGSPASNVRSSGRDEAETEGGDTSWESG